MSRVALLIGVNSYQPDLSLRAVGHGMEELYRVLLHPRAQMDAVQYLKGDLGLQEIQEAIEEFFRYRQPDDQLITAFAGYAVLERNQQLYFVTSSSYLDEHGELRRATAMPASFVQEVMDACAAKQQVMILECGFRQVLGDRAIPKETQISLEDFLGGRGRAILSATTQTQHRIPPENLEVWGYLDYLSEGIETGIADSNGDGTIAAKDLHEYAQSRLRIAAPGMAPLLAGSSETAEIPLFRVRLSHPALNYRKMIEQSLRAAEVDPGGTRLTTGRTLLEDMQRILGIPSQDAAEIEYQVLRPVREYRQRLLVYQKLYSELAARDSGSQRTRQSLKQWQQALGLTDRNTAAVDVAPYVAEQQGRREQHMENLTRYEQVLLAAAWRQFPISEGDRQGLQRLQQALGLSDDDARSAEQRMLEQIQQMRESSMLLEIMDGAEEPPATPPVAAAAAPTMVQPPGNPIANPAPPSPAAPASPNRDLIAEQLLRKQQQEAAMHAAAAPTAPAPPAPAISSPGVVAAPPPAPPPEPPPVVVEEAAVPSRPPAARQSFWALLIPALLVAALLGSLIALFSGGFQNSAPNLTAEAQQLLEQGDRKAQQGSYRDAIQDYDRAIQQDSKNVNAYIARGIAHHRTDDLSAAIRDYDQAIALEPDSALAYNNRSHVYYDQQNYRKALEDANWALKLNQNMAEAYINRANAQTKLSTDPKDINAAILDYGRAINLRPAASIQAGAYTNRGNARLLLNARNLDAAIQDYNQALKAAPNYAEAYFNRGSTYQAQGRVAQARKDFQEAARFYQQQGNTRMSEEATQRANAVQPGTNDSTPMPPAAQSR